MYAGAAALVLFLGVNIWALSAIGLFGGGSDGDPVAVRLIQDDKSPSPSTSSTTTPAVPQTTTPPPLLQTAPPPTVTPTRRPTQVPTKTRTTTAPIQQPPAPTPTATTTTPRWPKKTPKPRRTPTREEILQQYCIQRGIDPKYCDPANWQR